MSKNKLGLILKLLLTVAMFVFVLNLCDCASLIRKLRALPSLTVLSLISLSVVQVMMLAQRWRWITQSTGYSLGFSEALTGQLISQFFSQGLPASVGGDGVRVWWLTRHRVPMSVAVRNVFADRLAGLFSLLLLVVGSLALLLGFVKNTGPVWTLAAVTALGLLSFLALLLPWPMPLSRFSQLPARRWGQVLFRGARWLIQFRLQVLETCRSPRSLIRILGASIAVHLLTVLLGYAIARQLGVSITFPQCLATIVPALLVAYMPLSIAGWGVREGAIVLAFSLIGVSAADGVLVSVTIGIGSLAVALIGGGVWLIGGFRVLGVKSS